MRRGWRRWDPRQPPNDPALLLQEVARRDLVGEEHAACVDVEVEVPFLVGEIDRAVHRRDAGIRAEDLVAAHRGGSDYVIVPAHDRRGSNAILVSPPGAVPFAFGNDSFQPHLAAARAAGLDPVILPLPGIGLDCDNPEDMAMFAATPSATHTWRLLRQLNRLPAMTAR